MKELVCWRILRYRCVIKPYDILELMVCFILNYISSVFLRCHIVFLAEKAVEVFGFQSNLITDFINVKRGGGQQAGCDLQTLVGHIFGKGDAFCGFKAFAEIVVVDIEV